MSVLESGERVWYDANCHCRLVRVRLRIPPLYASEGSSTKPPQIFNCNCSICTKNGYLNVHPEDPKNDFEWVSGKDKLKRYEFGKGFCGHMFCPDCGSSIILLVDTSQVKDLGAEGGLKIAVNVSGFGGVAAPCFVPNVFQSPNLIPG